MLLRQLNFGADFLQKAEVCKEKASVDNTKGFQTKCPNPRRCGSVDRRHHIQSSHKSELQCAANFTFLWPLVTPGAPQLEACRSLFLYGARSFQYVIRNNTAKAKMELQNSDHIENIL